MLKTHIFYARRSVSHSLTSNDFGNPKSGTACRLSGENLPETPFEIKIQEVKFTRKRNNQINVRLSDSKLEKLKLKVVQSGLSREKYIRLALNSTKIHPSPPVDFYTLIREVRRVGSNLDRLLHCLNGKGCVQQNELSKMLFELDKLEQAMWQAFK